MNIIPINSAINTSSIGSLSRSAKSEISLDESDKLGFKQTFSDVIQNVEDTETATEVDAYNLSVGNTDDMHTMIIDAAKADLALQTMVQLRNKMLDAYTEIMRTNL